MAQVGDFVGNYRLAEVLSSGAFGQVFRAEHRWLVRRHVAIKYLRLERLNHSNEREQFLHEAQILNQLRHPAILPLLDFGLENEVPYLITEYASGSTLRAYLNKHVDQPLDLADALRIIEPIGEALQYAHENKIVHRDLKPENILFDAQKKPLLADFGIAIVLPTNSTFLGNIGGTAPYMAPEQFKGKVYQESDQYALGCLLYEMLTGQRPFQAPDLLALGFLHVHEPPLPPHQLNPQLLPHVDAAILKAMAKEREARHVNIKAFLSALQAQRLIDQPAIDTSTQPLQYLQKPLLDIDLSATGAPSGSLAQSAHSFNMVNPSTKPFQTNHPVLSQQTNGVLPGEIDGQRSPSWQHSAAERLSAVHQIPNTAPEWKKGFSIQDQTKISTIPSGSWIAPPPLIDTYPDAAFSSPHPQSRHGRRLLFLVSLLLMIILLLGAGTFWAKNDGSLPLFGHLAATVTITPQSQTVQNNYLISAVTTAPDAAQRQVAARTLSAQSNTQQATANATGSISATQASGRLRFLSTNTTATVLASTIITGNDGVQVTFNGPITVLANPPFIDVDAYTVNAGIAGNIKAQDISHMCCASGITVRNLAAFSGGRDAQPNSVIQQSNIDGAVRSLVAKLTASTRETLQKQIKSNERVADGSFVCPATTKADHNVGDHAPSVTVTVSVKCSEEVFDFAAAQQMASGLLQTNPPTNVNLANYQLGGPIITNLTSASQGSGQGQIGINMQAAGKWVYQFSSQQLQQIKQSLARQSKANAEKIIQLYPGILSAIITISRGSTMPLNASDITLDITPIPGLQQETSTNPSGGPTNTPLLLFHPHSGILLLLRFTALSS